MLATELNPAHRCLTSVLPHVPMLNGCHQPAPLRLASVDTVASLDDTAAHSTVSSSYAKCRYAPTEANMVAKYIRRANAGQSRDDGEPITIVGDCDDRYSKFKLNADDTLSLGRHWSVVSQSEEP